MGLAYLFQLFMHYQNLAVNARIGCSTVRPRNSQRLYFVVLDTMSDVQTECFGVRQIGIPITINFCYNFSCQLV